MQYSTSSAVWRRIYNRAGSDVMKTNIKTIGANKTTSLQTKAGNRGVVKALVKK
jgi:hypothetical protein